MVAVESLSDHDISFHDPGRASPYYIGHAPCRNTTIVSPGPIVTLPIPLLTRPLTAAALYQNLLRMLSHRYTSPPPSLPVLVSYIDSFYRQPYLYSARSFNLLISLAIRNAAFGTAERLLNTMRSQGVRGDLETWKLKIRWLIRVGRWTDAWEEVMRSIGRGRIHSRAPRFGDRNDGMPLPIWMEFFGTMKRGAIRRRSREEQDQKFVREPTFEVVQETEDRIGTDTSRFRSLMQHSPCLTPSERTKTPPGAVYLAVEMMIRMGQRKAAMIFTEAYLRSLPSEIDSRWSRLCLRIIHLHITSGSKQGLSAHHADRKTVDSLLAIHPQLRPNSTTLFLLLRQLKRTKRCGTVAQGFVRNFESKWGSRTVDQRVRRRVVSLALKEGRLDIVEAMFNTERVLGWPRRMWALQRDVLGGAEGKVYRRLSRGTDSQTFRKKGREMQKWRLLRRRAWHRIEQKWRRMSPS